MLGTLDPSALHHFGIQLASSELGERVVVVSDESDLAILPILRATLPKDFKLKRVSQLGDMPARESTATGSSATSNHYTAPPTTGSSDGASAVNRLNQLMTRCLEYRASDIHLEPRENSLHCRARIDGVLSLIEEIPRDKVAEVLSRLKIMAGLDIAEKRRPQDGRIRFEYQDRKVDIRVSIIPTEFGEKAVLRLLDKANLRLRLEDIGFSNDELALFREKIALPNGIILVTGPTGSGKTTTLYAALSHLKSSELNISTVENPIEYNLDGINQTQVKPEINVTFATMLRALLRQDPNVIMVGEIRDAETLDMATRASLTGHLVFSTLHTNDAPSTVTRLLNMGADPVVLASSLKLIVAQRLLRRLCPDCQVTGCDEANAAAAHRIGLGALNDSIRVGSGCKECRNTGFRGRLPVFEMLPISRSLAKAIAERANEDELRTIAGQSGFRSLHENALELVKRQLTTPSEVLREVNT